jgi:hypothetical protein
MKNSVYLPSGFLLFACIVFTNLSFAQVKEKRVGLAGDWRFTLGDNMKYAKPEYDDSDWEKIYVPSNWQREGFRNYHGYAWYRKKISIDFSKKDALYIELGKIDDVDEVYVNGNYIGRTGGFPPEYFTAYNYPRRYHIPTEYLKPGKNLIAVRVYDEGGEGGIMGLASAIGIYNYPNYSDNSVSLFGKWKFHLGDDMQWRAESLDDSEWEDIIVPGTWESQGFAKYDGFAWYRKSFKLPANFKTDDLLLLMGKIDDLDEVYVNGKLIGNTGRPDRRRTTENEWQKYRTYTVPDGLLKPGKYNVIAVRVYDQQGAGGIYEGPVTLLPQKEYKEFWKSYRMGRNSSETFSSWLSQFFE